jgi:flagellar hook-length control protein FliK
MIVAPPASSTLAVRGEAANDTVVSDGKSFASSQEPSRKPGEFLALLMLLFSEKLSFPNEAARSKGDGDPEQAQPILEGKQSKTDDSNAAVVAGLNAATSLLCEVLPAATPGSYSKSGICEPKVSDSSHLPNAANTAPPALTRREAITLPVSPEESMQPTPTDAAGAPEIALQQTGVSGRVGTEKTAFGALSHGVSLAMQQAGGSADEEPLASLSRGPVSSMHAIDGKGSGPDRAIGKVVRDSQHVPAVSTPASLAISRPLFIKQAAPAPELPDQMHHAITTFFEQARATGPSEADFDLHSSELGRVHFHLTMEDSRLNIHVVVYNDTAKRLLDLHREPWRARFAEIGVRVGQFDVRRDGESAQHRQAPLSEPCAQALQSGVRQAAGLGKNDATLAKRNTLVDVLA